ncbi:MAG: 50S ribosomal protein L6 [Candidatus Desulfovibrio kirbyi]|jgi:large subunit ribosomal protein L6|uniref:Large ribosomal subunit protein uL6 n=1 Tax=Candidatus Desulfovibrio kirbyi TaxID=2696086 RepID=A0A6L2R4X2_9BACT|nr:50S ribosomal protein L6 [Desulfovibrio sp.]GFH62636.1 MAG: 50S ribosomal protein L6 [Candidatus Desulfovibrio kirbyi]
MSRIGKLPIPLPAGVEVRVGSDVVEVRGPKGVLSTPVSPLLKYEVGDGRVTLTRYEESRQSRSQHGLRRTLLANCIEGVTKGFSKALEVIGVGYRVAVKGNMIELAVGFSHPVLVELPDGLKAVAEGQILTIIGLNKGLVGEFAARIRRIRKPEPYKGKGIKYVTETIRRKVGKSGGKK